MKSRAVGSFWRCFDKLPEDVQEQARSAYEHFRTDSNHRGLRFKKVHATRPIYSVRVTRDYRALGILKEHEILWFWIGSHDEYERMLARK